MWYVYVLKSKIDKNFYIGCANNLIKRFRRHNVGEVFSTRGRKPLILVYYEVCSDKVDAFQREKYLKTGMGKRYVNNRLKNYFKINGKNK